MSLFKEGTVEVRGTAYRVRELSWKERKEFLRLVKEDAISCGAYLAYVCTVEPKFKSLVEVEDLPPEFADKISAKVMEVSGMGKEEDAKKD